MAVRIQRDTSLEPRLEIMPLLDVIFLLLAFFIYAMVLLIRAEVLPVQLPELSQGRPATRSEAITITLDAKGALFLDAVPTDLDSVVAALKAQVELKPDARVYLAADMQGDADRLPVFIELVNRLRGSGIHEFFIVGRPGEQ
ncbi:MAG: biopolymer transporter ExbD [Phycisphaerales bacterium]|nr:biopolymer transporter ExbD [Phycisphaerales bacterium]